MKRSSRPARFPQLSLWLLLVALLWSSLGLVPGSRSDPHAALGEICTTEGVKRVALDSQAPTPADSSSSHGHCVGCPPAGHGPVAPGLAPVAWFSSGGTDESLRQRSVEPPGRVDVWLIPSPRAPPTLS